MLACDVSNHQGALSVETLRVWREQHGIELLIVQAVDPPRPWPPSQTRQQIEAAHAAGLAIDVYLWVWTHSLQVADMETKLRLLDGLEPLVGRLWLDAEDTAAATVEQRMGSIERSLQVLDAWSQARGLPLPGIYTGGWWWRGYLANTRQFGDRALWDAEYDGIADNAQGWHPYGGWTERAIKQYTASGRLPGYGGGLDLNALSETEAARVRGPQPPARETPEDWPWATWYEAAVNYRGIGDALGGQLTEAKATLDAQAADVATLQSQIDTWRAVVQVKETALKHADALLQQARERIHACASGACCRAGSSSDRWRRRSPNRPYHPARQRPTTTRGGAS
jgi:hypothetical protein